MEFIEKETEYLAESASTFTEISDESCVIVGVEMPKKPQYIKNEPTQKNSE